ncbi:MAG: ATP-binding protein [Chloroflexota bacterium]|nr:ATP-binding protein [Chloroflexota bacterium]
MHDALSGQGRLVMLAGEPGIGKTRTAQELAAYAKEHGVQVLWGWCYEEEGAPPYWPWVWWTQSATCWGMPIETSRTPPTPTVTRVSRASRTVRRSSGVAESSRSRICSLRAFKDATAAWPCSRVDMVSRCRSNSSVR